VTDGLIILAVLMAAVTYPSRAVPLLVPGVERLPPQVIDYLRLVGPAILAALAAVSVMVVSADGEPSFHVGVEWLAVGAGIALVARWRTLLVGLLVGAALVAILRELGLG
jgi:branched-subunit amino acid transport protein